MNPQSEYISRKLSWTDQDNRPHCINDDNLLTNYQCPIVVLGEPGMGKTELMEKLGDSDDCKFFRAAHFLRQTDDPIPEDARLIIDGLDEVAAMEEGDPLHNVLKKLIACGKPRFVISCRSAEWRGATARFDIEDDYGHAPKVLNLQPLSEEDAIEVLAREVGLNRARDAIHRLKSTGLETFFQNPLNLEFITSIVKEQGNFPKTKAKLFDRAVASLRLEHNLNHSNSALANLSEDEALDAAGSAMAVMLLTGEVSISKTQVGEGALCLSDLSGLTEIETVKAVLGSKLFRPDTPRDSADPRFFTPIHRTVAEFLGARWLAREVEKKSNSSQVTRRLLGLISAEGGVPASLRGLHAWLPKFSPERLGPGVIDRDSYGVLRYGDGDHLSASQVKQIIQGLRQLANFDPYFRYDWWENISIKGLAHSELVEEIRCIIGDTEESIYLRSLLLDAINGSNIATKLRPDLQAIMFDAKRDFYERKKACIAIYHIDNYKFDWSAELVRLSNMSDNESTRLAVELIPEIGIEKFSEKQIADAIIAHAGILNQKSVDSLHQSYGSLIELESNIPNERIKALLDELTAIVSPLREHDKWWDVDRNKGCRKISRFTEKIIAKQLQYDPSSVQPEQLWDWMRTLWSGQDDYDQDRRSVSKLIGDNDQLRLGIQRLALFSPGTEDKYLLRLFHLKNLCEALSITNDDARVHLSEVVARCDPTERTRWIALVSQFRRDDELIPKDIQAIALPYAADDQELKDLLTKKPKRIKLSESDKKFKRRMRDQDRRERKNIEKTRAEYTEHIDEVRLGELKWIFYPAKAYLGMLSDLRSDESISEWFGDDIMDAALIGFEAALFRRDLPTTKQIAEGYAESKIWNFAFPMLAAAGQRHLNGQGFRDLPDNLVSSLIIVAEHELPSSGGEFQGLKESLDSHIRGNHQIYEAHLRQKFEPMLASDMSHIPGLYRFVREDIERPLSTQLSLEWLEIFPELPLNIVNELIDCVIHAPKAELPGVWYELARIAEKRLGGLISDSDEEKVWRSVQFLINCETAIIHIPDITRENRDWLWSLTSGFYNLHEPDRQAFPVKLDQLKWIVAKFRYIWPQAGRPKGVMRGITNPWNATELHEWAIYQIAKDPSDEAALALSELRDMPHDGYTNYILSAIANNHRVQIEAKFKSPSLVEIKAVLADQQPESAADVQSIVLDKISELQGRLRGDPLNPVNNFYDDNGKPRTENECRNQMLIALGELPFGIQSPTEVAMPQGRRSDGAFVFGCIEVPLEVKGQWHKEVWTAATSQLDRYYTVSYKSASKGIYIVFWFGKEVPAGKRLKLPPTGGRKPQSPEDMRIALQTLITSGRQSDIAIVVLDVTKT